MVSNVIKFVLIIYAMLMPDVELVSRCATNYLCGVSKLWERGLTRPEIASVTEPDFCGWT